MFARSLVAGVLFWLCWCVAGLAYFSRSGRCKYLQLATIVPVELAS